MEASGLANIEVRWWAGRALSINVRNLGEPGWPRSHR